MLTALWPDVALAGTLKPVRKGREREEGGGRGGVWRKRKREMGREIEREESKRGRGEEKRREGEKGESGMQGRIGALSFNMHIQSPSTGCHSPVRP